MNKTSANIPQVYRTSNETVEEGYLRLDNERSSQRKSRNINRKPIRPRKETDLFVLHYMIYFVVSPGS
jgi:hypothetical protein